jgi:hypothetical protein
MSRPGVSEDKAPGGRHLDRGDIHAPQRDRKSLSQLALRMEPRPMMKENLPTRQEVSSTCSKDWWSLGQQCRMASRRGQICCLPLFQKGVVVVQTDITCT